MTCWKHRGRLSLSLTCIFFFFGVSMFLEFLVVTCIDNDTSMEQHTYRHTHTQKHNRIYQRHTWVTYMDCTIHRKAKTPHFCTCFKKELAMIDCVFYFPCDTSCLVSSGFLCITNDITKYMTNCMTNCIPSRCNTSSRVFSLVTNLEKTTLARDFLASYTHTHEKMKRRGNRHVCQMFKELSSIQLVYITLF